MHNSLRAYTGEGFLSEEYLRLRLIFFFWLGGGGGLNYYWNFLVFSNDGSVGRKQLLF